MTRIIFAVIVGFHGLVHVMGFVKAFGLHEIKELTQSISRPLGLIWLLAFLLFMGAVIQYLMHNEMWWMTAFIGILISQVLVILFWSDAKFGTIPNLIILIVSVIALAGFVFDRNVSREVDRMFSLRANRESAAVTKDMMKDLPAPVRKWIENSGIIGKEDINTVRLKQKAFMKMKPEQAKWADACAVQYFTLDPPAFIWKVDMRMMPLVKIAGRDKFYEGKGEMLIKLLSLFPVVNSRGNEKIDVSTLQRYLGEMVWFPSAALSPYISWEKMGDFSAKASMTYLGTTGSGVFYFSEAGDFMKFSAQRYMGSEDDAELHEWIITANESKVMNGVRIPVKLEATWKLKKADWTWLKLEITDIEYNTVKRYR